MRRCGAVEVGAGDGVAETLLRQWTGLTGRRTVSAGKGMRCGCRTIAIPVQGYALKSGVVESHILR